MRERGGALLRVRYFQARADQIRYPVAEEFPHIDPLIAQQPVDLFYSVLAQLAQGLGQSLTDRSCTANEALTSTPKVALASDNTRLACKSPSYKLSIKSAMTSSSAGCSSVPSSVPVHKREDLMMISSEMLCKYDEKLGE